MNCVNCWKPLRAYAATAYLETESANAKNAEDWAISRQALQECSEGSTTRPRSPERTVKAQECATRKGRYSLSYRESDRNADKEPHDNNLNSVPFSNKLESLSKFEVKKPIMQALKNDAKKVFDRAAYAQFYQTPLRVVPTGGTATDAITLTTNGTATLTNNIAYGNNHAKAIVDTMKERNIAPYVGDDYMSIAWPTTLRAFKNNLESLHQYTESGIKLIFNGEIGRYENVRYTEQTNVSKGITATGSSGTAWTNAKSDWIFFFGEDTVAEGIAVPEEMRAKIPTDYGRSKGVAYYYLGGFGIVHTDASQARVVIWDSAL